MELTKYLNQELKGVIQSVRVEEGKAKDSGNPYCYIHLFFINGYDMRLYLNNEQKFAWLNAIEQLDMQKQVNVEFN